MVPRPAVPHVRDVPSIRRAGHRRVQPSAAGITQMDATAVVMHVQISMHVVQMHIIVRVVSDTVLRRDIIQLVVRQQHVQDKNNVRPVRTAVVVFHIRVRRVHTGHRRG